MKNFRKRIQINLGTVVFGLVFIYILFSVILYLTRNRVSIYEVTTGSIVENQSYTGLVLRQEEVCFAEGSGTLTLIAREGTKVGMRTPVYAATDGSLTQVIESNPDGGTLTEEDYDALYDEIAGFSNGFRGDAFQTVYTFKAGLDGMILNAMNGADISGDSQTQTSMGVHLAKDAGVVVYSIDGMESVTYETFTPDMMNSTALQTEDLKKRETVNTGDPVYKLITDEDWEIIVTIDPSEREKYKDGDYVEVRFLKDQTTAWAQVSTFEKDGSWFCRMQFTNSMVRFAADRFLDIEVLLESTTGLKVPNSAIVEKKFYTVPREFLEINESEDTIGFYVYKTDKNGKVSETYQEINPYNLTEEEAYLDMDEYKKGTTIVKKGTTELYTIQDVGKLIGVYNVNRGYADFCIVTMEYQNDDYSIVKTNESYGLTQYDRIVLDGSSVNDEETIYQ